MKKIKIRGFIFIFFVILFLFNARVSFATDWLLFETTKIQGKTVITDLEKGRFDQGWMISQYRSNQYIDVPLENRFRLGNDDYYTASFKDPSYTQASQSARFKYDRDFGGYIFGASISQNINLPGSAIAIGPSSSTMKISSIKIPVADNGVITVSAEVAMNNLVAPDFWEMFPAKEPNKVNLVVWFLGNDGNVKGHTIKSVNIEKANQWYKLESSFGPNERPSGTRYVAIDIWPSVLGPYEGPWWFGYYNLYVKDIKVVGTQLFFGTGSINIEYRDVNGKLLQSETKSGQTGKDYTTEPPEELKVGGDTYVWNGKYPPNAIGLYSWSSEKVVYYYEKSEGPDLPSNEIQWNNMTGTYDKETQTLEITGGNIHISSSSSSDGKTIGSQPIYYKHDKLEVSKEDIKQVNFTKDLTATSVSDDVILWNMFSCEEGEGFCSLEKVTGFDKISSEKMLDITEIFMNTPISEVFLKKATNTYSIYAGAFENMKNLTKVSISGQEESSSLSLMLDGSAGEDTFEGDNKLQEIEITFSETTADGKKVMLGFEAANLPESSDRDVDDSSFFKNENSGWISRDNEEAYTSDSLKEGIEVAVTPRDGGYQSIILEWQPRGNDIKVDSKGAISGNSDIQEIGLYSYHGFELNRDQIDQIKEVKRGDTTVWSKDKPTQKKDNPEVYIEGNKLYIKSTKDYNDFSQISYTVTTEGQNPSNEIKWNEMTGTYDEDTNTLIITGGEIQNNNWDYWSNSEIKYKNGDPISKNEIQTVIFQANVKATDNRIAVDLGNMFSCNERFNKGFCNLKSIEGFDKIYPGYKEKKLYLFETFANNKYISDLQLKKESNIYSSYQKSFQNMINLESVLISGHHENDELSLGEKQVLTDMFEGDKKLKKIEISFSGSSKNNKAKLELADAKLPQSTERISDDSFFKNEKSGWIIRNKQLAYTYEELTSNNGISVPVTASEDEYRSVILEWQPRGNNIQVGDQSSGEIGLYSEHKFEIELGDKEKITEVKKGDETVWRADSYTPQSEVSVSGNKVFIKSIEEYRNHNSIEYTVIKGDRYSANAVEWNEMTGTYDEGTQTLTITGGRIYTSNQSISKDEIKYRQKDEVIEKNKIKNVVFKYDISASSTSKTVDLSYMFACVQGKDSFCNLVSVKDINKIGPASGNELDISGLFLNNEHIKEVTLKKSTGTYSSYNDAFSNMSKLEKVTVPGWVKFPYSYLDLGQDTFKHDNSLSEIEVAFSGLSTTAIIRSTGYFSFMDANLPPSKDRKAPEGSFFKTKNSGWISEGSKAAYTQEQLSKDIIRAILETKFLDTHKYFIMKWQPQGNHVSVDMDGHVKTIDNIGLYSYAAFDIPDGKEVVRIKDNNTGSNISFSKVPPKSGKVEPDAYVDGNKVYIKSLNEFKNIQNKEYTIYFKPVYQGSVNIMWNDMTGTYNFDTQQLKLTGGTIKQPVLEKDADKNKYWPDQNIQVVNHDQIINKNEIKSVQFDKNISLENKLVYLNYMFAAQSFDETKDVCNNEKDKKKYFCNLKELKGLENLSNGKVVFQGFLKGNQGLQTLDLTGLNVSVDNTQYPFVQAFAQTDLKEINFPKQYSDSNNPVELKQAFTQAEYLEKITLPTLPKGLSYDFSNSSIPSAPSRNTEALSPFYNTMESGWIDPKAQVAYTYTDLNSNTQLVPSTDENYELIWQPQGSDITVMTNYEVELDKITGIGQYSYASIYLPSGKTTDDIEAINRGYGDTAVSVENWRTAQLSPGKPTPEVYVDKEQNIVYIKVLNTYDDNPELFYEILFKEDGVDIPQEGNKNIQWNDMTGVYHEDTQSLYITDGSINQNIKGFPFDSFSSYWASQPVLDVSDTERQIISKSEIKHVYFTKKIVMSNHYSDETIAQENVYLVNMFARTPVKSDKDLNKRPFAGEQVCDQPAKKDNYFCNLESISGLQYLISAQPVNIYSMFAGNNKLKDLDLGKINTTFASFTAGSYLQGTVANMSELEKVILPKKINDPTYGILLTNAFTDDKKLSNISIPYLGSEMHRVTFKNSGLPEPEDRETDDAFYRSNNSGWINKKAKIAYDNATLNRDSGIYIMSQKDKKPTELTWQPQGSNVEVKFTKDKKKLSQEEANDIGLYGYMKAKLPDNNDIDWIKLNGNKVSFKNYKPDLTKESPTAYVDHGDVYLKSEFEKGKTSSSYEVHVKDKPILKDLDSSGAYIPKDRVYMPTRIGSDVVVTKCANVVLPQNLGENITCDDKGNIWVDGKKQEQGIAVSRLIGKPLHVPDPTDLDGIQQVINTDGLNGYVYIPKDAMEKNKASYLTFKNLGRYSDGTPATVTVTFKKTTEDIPMYQSSDIHQLGYISLHEENFLSFNMPYSNVTMTYNFDKATRGNITLASQYYSLMPEQADGYYFDQEDDEPSPFEYQAVGKTNKKIYHDAGQDLLTLTFNASGKSFSLNYSDTMYGYSDVNIILPEIPLEIPDPKGIDEKFDTVTEENQDKLYLTFKQYIPYMNNNDFKTSWEIKAEKSPLMMMNFSDTAILVEDSHQNIYLAQDIFNIENQEDKGVLTLQDDLSYNQWYTVHIPLDFVLGVENVKGQLDKGYTTNKYDVTLSQSLVSDTPTDSKGTMNTKINFKAQYTQEYNGIPKDPDIQDANVYLTQLYKEAAAIETIEDVFSREKVNYILVGSEPPADTPILLSESTITYEYEKLEEGMKLDQSKRWQDTEKKSIPNDYSYAPLYAENMKSCASFNSKCQEIAEKQEVTLSKDSTTYIQNVFYDGNQWVHLSIKNNAGGVSVSLQDEGFLSIQGKDVNVDFEFYTIGTAKRNKDKQVSYRMKGYLPFSLNRDDSIELNPNQMTDMYAKKQDASDITYGAQNKNIKLTSLADTRLYVLFNTKVINLKGNNGIKFQLPEQPLTVEHPDPIQVSSTKYDRINKENYDALTMSVYQFIPYDPKSNIKDVKVDYAEQNIMKNNKLVVKDFIENEESTISPENGKYTVFLSNSHNRYYEYQLPIEFPKEPVNIKQLNRGYADTQAQLISQDKEVFTMQTTVNFKSHVKLVVQLPVKSWGRWKRQTVFNNKNYYITQPFPKEHVPDTYTYKGKTYVRSVDIDIPDVIQYTDENRVFDYISVTQSLTAPEKMSFGYAKAGSSKLVPIKKPNPWILQSETNAPNNNWHVIVKQTQPFVNDKGQSICEEGKTCFKYKAAQYYNDLSIDQPVSLNYQDFEQTGKNDGKYVWEAKWGSRGSKSHGLYFDPGDVPLNTRKKVPYTSELEFKLNITL